ncbi:MAG: AtpZ/AtpI family protein [Bacteroidetes bacterium]|jgi:F0F1-type ATP synthase assembly protein I|nr:MAG: AtpZ/AtpI family protein [Bacteroidota bacterium]
MPDKPSPRNEYLKYAGLGFEILACVLLFVGAGYGLDRLAGTAKPWFLLTFSLIGCAAALFLIIRKFGNPPRP